VTQANHHWTMADDSKEISKRLAADATQAHEMIVLVRETKRLYRVYQTSSRIIINAEIHCGPPMTGFVLLPEYHPLTVRLSYREATKVYCWLVAVEVGRVEFRDLPLDVRDLLNDY
jgi:hypothetical protein